MTHMNMPAIPADNNTPVAYKGVPVMTTEMLASAYGADTSNIKMNHSRNASRFTEGLHYFKITGAELKAFKNSVTDSYSVGNRAPALTLWTEKGAARHAKILDTDEAWGVYEKLEETYFAVKDFAAAVEAKRAPKTTIRGTNISGALIRAVTDFPEKLRRQFPNLSDDAVQAAYSHLSEVAFGSPLIPLPAVEHGFTTTQLAANLGMSVQKLSRKEAFKALKTPAHGELRLSKSEHSDKQVEQFHWNAAGHDAVMAAFGKGE